jgi:hypothetical protein
MYVHMQAQLHIDNGINVNQYEIYEGMLNTWYDSYF